ncbi:MAG: recombinase family protein [Bacilli bacterium]
MKIEYKKGAFNQSSKFSIAGNVEESFKGLNVFGYIRVSSEEQKRYGHGADRQESDIRYYLTRNDIKIPKENIFKDLGYSGGKEKRPAFQELLKLINSNKVDVLIITSTERISRSIVFREKLFSKMQKKGIKLITLLETFDWDSADGRSNNRNKAVADQGEIERARERTIRSLDQSAMSGNYAKAGLPRGFERAPEDRYFKKRIQPIEKYRKEIQGVWKMLLTHQYSILAISQHLDSIKAMGLGWTDLQVRTMIMNPIYAGIYENDRIRIVDHTEKIISEEMFLEGLKAIKKRSKKTLNGYIFKNLVLCESCGIRVSQESTHKSNGRIYLYYRCPKCRKRINQKKLFELTSDQFDDMCLQESKEEHLKLLLEKRYKLNLVVCNLSENFITSDISEVYFEDNLKKFREDLMKINRDIDLIKKQKKVGWKYLDKYNRREFLKKNINYISYNYNTGIAKLVKVRYNKADQ